MLGSGLGSGSGLGLGLGLGLGFGFGLERVWDGHGTLFDYNLMVV